MTQLILNGGIALPETSKDKYRCYPSILNQQVEMISGRLVEEVRGTVQMIEYSYDYMGNDLMRAVLGILRGGTSFPVAYLPDEGNSLITGIFLTQDISQPTMAFSKGGIPYWHNFSFTLREVKPHDLMLLFFAALFAVVFNQGTYIFGLSLTSPIDASIITTTAPIATLILAAIFLHEPITGKKIGGVFLGAIGALIMILGSNAATGGNSSNALGDLLCFTAQVSFAAYLTFFKGLPVKYHPVTCMKWMFTYAAICFIPFSYSEVSVIPFAEVGWKTWGEVAFVVVCSTFMSFLLLMTAQKVLRPTVLSMYNYMQPIVASVVSVIMGIGSRGHRC